MAPNKRLALLVAPLVALFVAGWAWASPADEAVESYLRSNRMDSLLEVQLESRLAQAGDEVERAELGEELSELYMRLLREVDAGEAYHELLLHRAQALVSRLDQVPMYDLRIELLVNSFSANETAIELHRLSLLEPDAEDSAREAFIETRRGLERLLRSLEPELESVNTKRTRATGLVERTQHESKLESLRRQRSLAYYYLAWSGYGIAVLEERHVADEVFIAFGWLLGAEGGIPQSMELRLAALEYEHVARSAMGVALCYAQSEDGSLADTWLDSLLASDIIAPHVRRDAQGRRLQVLADSREWYKAHALAQDLIREDGKLGVADARFIAIRALDARSGLSGSSRELELVDQLAQVAIEQLVDMGEIGHVVDLYQRYTRLPVLTTGFIPNYARALARLEQAEQGERSPPFLAIAEEFNQALKSTDSGDYPKHREDCRLKLAYTLIRGDRPKDALSHCERVIETTLNAVSKEEARWLQIAALDRINSLENRTESSELDEAVRAYAQAYPATQRTAKLVLRHAMRGTLDDRMAIDTLRAIDEDDPIAVTARRTLVQLLYQRLRTTGFDDQRMLSEARALIYWLIEQHDMLDSSPEETRSRIAMLRIGVDLAVHDQPPDDREALRLLERADALVEDSSGASPIEAELIYQRIQVLLLTDRLDEAIALIDRLKEIDEQSAQNAQVLVLNTLIELWGTQPDLGLATRMVDIASPVLARVTPRAPETIGVQTSALIEMVAHAAMLLNDNQENTARSSLALQLSRQVLARGQPSEQGLRRTTQIAEHFDDDALELDAWLRLLAAYPPDEDRWFEARFQSLAVMQRIDPMRALDSFEQYRVLNPTLGPEPWGTRIAELFNQRRATPGSGNGGGAP